MKKLLTIVVTIVTIIVLVLVGSGLKKEYVAVTTDMLKRYAEIELRVVDINNYELTNVDISEDYVSFNVSISGEDDYLYSIGTPIDNLIETIE